MTTALVLSGGGAKGSFQVGALQYLYENGFLANIICGTSVGSVNALQLAHGGTATTQAAAYSTLMAIWDTELTFNEDMYAEAPWLKKIPPRTRESIASMFTGRIDYSSLASQTLLFPPFAIGQAVAVIADLGAALDALSRASSVFTLDPTRNKIAAHLNRTAVAQSGVQLRLVVVSLDSGAIRYVNEHGQVVETDGRPVAGPNPTVCTVERTTDNAAMKAKTAAGRAVAQDPRDPEARLDYQRASAAAAQAKEALERCIAGASAAGTVTQLTVDLLDGTIASSAIPCAFPAVMLGDEAYVDGGVRWNLPLQAAVDFDPEYIVAINTSPGGVSPARRAYRDATMLDVAERVALDIELWEMQERHMRAVRSQSTQRGQQVWVITPRLEVHDTLTIDPGLIDINGGYGYMCAADVTPALPFEPPAPIPRIGPVRNGPAAGPGFRARPPSRTAAFVEASVDPAQGALADAIARFRRTCWEAEHRVFARRAHETPFAPTSEIVGLPDPDALDQVRDLKVLIGMLVEARRVSAGRLPPDASGWADRWERHRWLASDVPGVGDTPWNSFVSGSGNRPAATRPTILVVRAPGEAPVFLLNPLRHWITSPAALAPFGGFAVVKEVPAEFLNVIPRGADISG